MDASLYPLLKITAKNSILNLLTSKAAREYDILHFYASGFLTFANFVKELIRYL